MKVDAAAAAYAYKNMACTTFNGLGFIGQTNEALTFKICFLP